MARYPGVMYRACAEHVGMRGVRGSDVPMTGSADYVTCPTCDGAETIRCTDPDCDPDDGDRHEHWVDCPGCSGETGHDREA